MLCKYKDKIHLCMFIVLFLQLLSRTAAQSCARSCGEKFTTCSCHATCESLKDCCADYKQFCLDVEPHSGSLLGGTDFKILNVTFEQNINLTCRFNSEILTEGYVDVSGVGHCISPLLYESGWIPFEVSTDGVNYDRAGRWLSAEFEITVPRGPVTGFYGEALILPCTFPVDLWDLSSTLISWKHGLDVVHSFYYSRDQLERQNPHYVNRTSLFIQEMAGGNASLKLHKVTLQDSGVYTCSISTNTGSQKKSFTVNIAAFYSEPRLQFSMLTDGVNLLVTSDGGYPSPTLQWLMENSDITNQTQTHIMKDTQTGLYIVSSWINLKEITKTFLTFILYNKLLGQDIRREIQLYSDKRESQGESAYRCHGCFILIPVILLLLIVMGLLFVFIISRRREQTKLNGFTNMGLKSETQILNGKFQQCPGA